MSAAQLSAMDPDLDGDTDGVDISYLMRVVANKYRFVSAFNATAVPFALEATIRTSSSDLASSAQTSVAYEIGTSLNLAMNFSTGIGSYQTSDGVVSAFNATAVPFAIPHVGWS